MPVKAYVGEPRSGKTYELCSVVILEALKQGRRVISNIAGLNYEAYVELIKRDFPQVENIGKIINLQHEEVKKADFWLTDLTANDERHERQIQRGDFLVLDEVWRFWDGFNRTDSEGVKRPESVLNFFRMHGQMPHPVTGYICEIALITQDLSDLHRSVKNILNQTYVTTKHTALGVSKRYRLDIFHKSNTRRKPLDSYQKTYDSKYFDLYKSHSTKKEGDANALEVSTDKRGNLLNSALIKVGIPIALVCFVFGIYFAWGFFHPKPKTVVTNDKPIIQAAAPLPVAAAPVQTIAPVTPTSSVWFIHGKFIKNGLNVFVLANSEGAFRYVTNPDSSRSVLAEKIYIDGEIINNWLPKQQNYNQGLIK